jgi:hypothetical protein
MKFEPEIEHLKRWFYAERDSGHGMDQCMKIADFIAQAKRYSEEDKIEFLSRKATNLYTRGREEIYFSSEKGFADISESLRLHLVCFTKNFEISSLKLDKSEEYARNTAYFIFDFAVLHGQLDIFSSIVSSLCSDAGIKLDPIELPLMRSIDLIGRERVSRAETSKRRNKLEGLRKIIEAKSSWYDEPAKRRVIDRLVKSTE